MAKPATRKRDPINWQYLRFDIWLFLTLAYVLGVFVYAHYAFYKQSPWLLAAPVVLFAGWLYINSKEPR